MRSQNNMSVSLHIDATTEMSKKFIDFVNSEACDKLCDAALANPTGREARILLSKIRPLIQICGSRTKWCPFERAACKGKLFVFILVCVCVCVCVCTHSLHLCQTSLYNARRLSAHLTVKWTHVSGKARCRKSSQGSTGFARN